MKLEKIIEINNNINKIKSLNKVLSIDLCLKLLRNLEITNEIIDVKNKELTDLLCNSGIFDGYEYIIDNDEDAKLKYDKINNEDIQCDLIEITKYDFDNCLIDLQTIELIIPMLKIKK